MNDTIGRQWLVECVEEGWIKFDTQEDENRFVHLIRDIAPSAQRLLEDGTLIVKVPNLSAVHRVIVDEENSQYCKTFYQDGDEDE